MSRKCLVSCTPSMRAAVCERRTRKESASLDMLLHTFGGFVGLLGIGWCLGLNESLQAERPSVASRLAMAFGIRTRARVTSFAFQNQMRRARTAALEGQVRISKWAQSRCPNSSPGCTHGIWCCSGRRVEFTPAASICTQLHGEVRECVLAEVLLHAESLAATPAFTEARPNLLSSF
jgi:hypothetical protein